MGRSLLIFGALVALFSPAAAQNANNRLPGETAPDSAMPVIRDLINRGEPLPHEIGTTHVCGDMYPADGPAIRPKEGPLLGFHITAEGEVTNITIVRSSGNAALDKAAIACVHRWKYSPAKNHGQPIALDWQNNIAWTQPEPASGPPDIVIQVDAPPPTNVITTQSRIATPPPISMPASVGKPHACTTDYPQEAIEARAEGTTMLGFTISEQGTVTNLRILRTSGNTSLDNAAVDCAKDWRYKPAIENSKPIAVPWRADVKWSLDDYLPPPDIVIQTDGPPPANVITVQSRNASPPPISSPASIGKPHVCTQDYPKEAVAARMQGISVIGFIITDRGIVQNAHLVTSSGYPLLDDAAVKCASSWLYKPARENGKDIAVRWRADVRWSLPPENGTDHP